MFAAHAAVFIAATPDIHEGMTSMNVGDILSGDVVNVNTGWTDSRNTLRAEKEQLDQSKAEKVLI